MPTITIRHRFTGAVLYSHETTDERQSSGLAMRDALEAAVKSGSDLRGSDLSYSNLIGSNLSGSDLSGSSLIGSNLRGSDLRGSNLSYSNLIGSNLSGSDLRGSDLSCSTLIGSDLSGSDLRGSNLIGGLKLVGARPFFAIGPIGSESRTVFAWITAAGLRIQAGCFFGTRDEFTAKLFETHGDNDHAQEYTAALVLIDMHAQLWTPAAELANAA